MKLSARRIATRLSIENLWKKAKVASLLAAIATSAVLTAAAQMNQAGMMPERGAAGQLQAQQFISTNALRAPDKAQVALQHAREALMRGRDTEAGKDLERALQIYPNYALALQLRGLISMRSNHLEEAGADFQQAIHLDPNLGVAYLALGAVYNRLGQFNDATFQLNRATAILPTSWFVHYQSAVACLGTGKIEAAWQAISRAADNLPDQPSSRSAIFYIKARVQVELGNYQDAKAVLKEAVDEDPQGEFARLALQSLDHLNSQQEQRQPVRSLPGSWPLN